jgi:hypothetical protein
MALATIRRRWPSVKELPSRACPPHNSPCAQLYAARRAGPKDLVHAYTCFLIAGEQITQTKNHLNQSMTMGQLLEAEQRPNGSEKMRKIPPSSIENPPNASTA